MRVAAALLVLASVAAVSPANVPYRTDASPMKSCLGIDPQPGEFPPVGFGTPHGGRVGEGRTPFIAQAAAVPPTATVNLATSRCHPSLPQCISTPMPTCATCRWGRI